MKGGLLWQCQYKLLLSFLVSIIWTCQLIHPISYIVVVFYNYYLLIKFEFLLIGFLRQYCVISLSYYSEHEIMCCLCQWCNCSHTVWSFTWYFPVSHYLMVCHLLICFQFFLLLQIEVILKFEEMCLESAKEFASLFTKVWLSFRS